MDALSLINLVPAAPIQPVEANKNAVVVQLLPAEDGSWTTATSIICRDSETLPALRELAQRILAAVEE